MWAPFRIFTPRFAAWRTRARQSLVISSYLPEILAVSDRILVARTGRIVAEFDAADATQDKILYAAVH
jgi:ABC-type sugar transport system ATPase subunit